MQIKLLRQQLKQTLPRFSIQNAREDKVTISYKSDDLYNRVAQNGLAVVAAFMFQFGPL